jgi:Mn2+/Fe2+ NRAMP family transporter
VSTQIAWQGRVLEEGPRLVLLLADRIGQETGAAGRAVFLLGFWGAAYSSVLGVWHGVPYLFEDGFHLWRGRVRDPRRRLAYRGYVLYLTLASISALLLRRPVWLLFVYTVVGSLFFPFVISTLIWLNNDRRRVPRHLRNRTMINTGLGLALLLYVYLAVRTVWAMI